MKNKKLLYVILVIIILIATNVGSFFLGRFSYKKSLEQDNTYNTSAKDKDTETHKTYAIGETITTDLYEICFKEISFNDIICFNNYHDTETGHEEFLKAIQPQDPSDTYNHDNMQYYNAYNTKKTATSGMTFVTIEYTIKNISSDLIDLIGLEAYSKFTLTYDDNYNFVDNSTSTSKTPETHCYVEVIGENTKVWNTTQTLYRLNPLSDAIRVREYIMTSDVVKNEDKSLVLMKQFRGTDLMKNDEIYIKIR